MEYIILAFRSRSDTIEFGGKIKNSGIPAEIINTPKEAGIGCGLSVKIPTNYFSASKRVLQFLRLKSFAGFFLVKKYGNNLSVRSI